MIVIVRTVCCDGISTAPCICQPLVRCLAGVPVCGVPYSAVFGSTVDTGLCQSAKVSLGYGLCFATETVMHRTFCATSCLDKDVDMPVVVPGIDVQKTVEPGSCSSSIRSSRLCLATETRTHSATVQSAAGRVVSSGQLTRSFWALHTGAGPGGSCPLGHGPPQLGASTMANGDMCHKSSVRTTTTTTTTPPPPPTHPPTHTPAHTTTTTTHPHHPHQHHQTPSCPRLPGSFRGDLVFCWPWLAVVVLVGARVSAGGGIGCACRRRERRLRSFLRHERMAVAMASTTHKPLVPPLPPVLSHLPKLTLIFFVRFASALVFFWEGRPHGAALGLSRARTEAGLPLGCRKGRRCCMTLVLVCRSSHRYPRHSSHS